MKLSFFKKIIFICLFFIAAAGFLAADTTYKVEKGDTLYSISRKYQITVAELRAANNLSENDVIKVGQKLKIPSADISAAAALATDNKATTTSSSATLSATTKTKEYTVVKGDTMYSIAKKNDDLVITLKAKPDAKGSMKHIQVYLEQNTHKPKRLRIKVLSLFWANVYFSDFKAGGIDDNLFVFPREEYANCKIVDER